LFEHEKRVHGGIHSEVLVHTSDRVSRDSSLQHEDLHQSSEIGSVERNFSEDNQAESLREGTLNALSDDPEKLKRHLKMLRAERGELERALADLDKDIMGTERSLLDAICA
jgi:hypothetical protein